MWPTVHYERKLITPPSRKYLLLMWVCFVFCVCVAPRSPASHHVLQLLPTQRTDVKGGAQTVGPTLSRGETNSCSVSVYPHCRLGPSNGSQILYKVLNI